MFQGGGKILDHDREFSEEVGKFSTTTKNFPRRWENSRPRQRIFRGVGKILDHDKECSKEAESFYLVKKN
jgi:hypothetical protein